MYPFKFIKAVQVFALIGVALVAIKTPALAASPLTTIKIAVLENLKIEKLSTDKYARDYMDGLDVAVHEAEGIGYRLEFKTFFYDKEPLAILAQIPAVKAWDPDIVLGPRSSSLFLLMKGQLDDRLVLSPFATANEVAAMPDNFYSLTLPNEFFTQAVVNLVRKRFPGRAVAPVVELDCKNCQDFTETFERLAKSETIQVRPRAPFLNKTAESSSLTSLLSAYVPGDVILLPNTSYTSGTLIARISDHLRIPEPVFIGGDGWGDWTSSYVGKVKSQFSYVGYRVTPWSIHAQDERTRLFHEKYRLVKGYEPMGPASLMSYATVMTPIRALVGKPRESVRQHVLSSFKAARKSNPNFGRPIEYTIYKVTQQGEECVGTISALGKDK